MTRPSEIPHAGVATLRDREVSDWIEARPHAAILFWDADDAACQRLRARLELVAASANVPLGIVDVRTDALVAQALGVKSVPTLVAFRGGEVVDRVMGAAPEAILRQALST